MICYNKLLDMFKERGITSYTFRQNKIIAQSTYMKILGGEYISTKSVDALCKYLNCQPGDILEYIPDEAN